MGKHMTDKFYNIVLDITGKEGSLTPPSIFKDSEYELSWIRKEVLEQVIESVPHHKLPYHHLDMSRIENVFMGFLDEKPLTLDEEGEVTDYACSLYKNILKAAFENQQLIELDEDKLSYIVNAAFISTDDNGRVSLIINTI